MPIYEFGAWSLVCWELTYFFQPESLQQQSMFKQWHLLSWIHQ